MLLQCRRKGLLSVVMTNSITLGVLMPTSFVWVDFTMEVWKPDRLGVRT